MTIIVDQSQYHRRTNRVPPKKGDVDAVFMVGEIRVDVVGYTYQAAIEVAKQSARRHNAQYITLVDVQPAKIR